MTTSPPPGYEMNEQGRRFISRWNLDLLSRQSPERVIKARIDEQPSCVVFLDAPYRLGTRSADKIMLNRIRLGDLPGWKRLHVSPGGTIQPLLKVGNYSYTTCTFVRCSEPGPQGVEITLLCDSRERLLWLYGCPEPLMKCAFATLRQSSVAGLKLNDLGELRLLSAG